MRKLKAQAEGVSAGTEADANPLGLVSNTHSPLSWGGLQIHPRGRARRTFLPHQCLSRQLFWLLLKKRSQFTTLSVFNVSVHLKRGSVVDFVRYILSHVHTNEAESQSPVLQKGKLENPTDMQGTLLVLGSRL